MIICLCQQVCENELIQALASNNLKEFLEERKPGVGCEICIPSLAKLIRDYNYSEQFCENE